MLMGAQAWLPAGWRIEVELEPSGRLVCWAFSPAGDRVGCGITNLAAGDWPVAEHVIGAHLETCVRAFSFREETR